MEWHLGTTKHTKKARPAKKGQTSKETNKNWNPKIDSRVLFELCGFSKKKIQIVSAPVYKWKTFSIFLQENLQKLRKHASLFNAKIVYLTCTSIWRPQDAVQESSLAVLVFCVSRNSAIKYCTKQQIWLFSFTVQICRNVGKDGYKLCGPRVGFRSITVDPNMNKSKSQLIRSLLEIKFVSRMC